LGRLSASVIISAVLGAASGVRLVGAKEVDTSDAALTGAAEAAARARSMAAGAAAEEPAGLYLATQ